VLEQIWCGSAVKRFSAQAVVPLLQRPGGKTMGSQLEGFLNLLGEAERAGGRVLHELTDQAKSLELREMLKKVGHDEGYYAGELAAHVRRLGGTPSKKTGDFVEKVRAVGDFRGKLELLNRGQRWVIRKIEENAGTVGDAGLKAFLVVMAQGHRVNIGALEDTLKEGVV
jgi:nitronate monooxygenase